jgi:hypothetical protein
VTDIEDAPVNGNGEPLEAAPETPKPVAPEPAPGAQPPAAIPVTPAVEVAAPAERELPVEPAPAEQLTMAVPEFAAPAVATEVAVDEEVPEDLRALTESLEQPTGQMVAVGDAAEVAEPAADEAADDAAAAAEDEAAASEDAAAAATDAAAAAGDSLDDIAPGTVTAESVAADASLGEVEMPKTKVSWWPFVGYIVVWLGAAAYAVWQLERLPASQVAYETNFYSMTMLAGLVLLAAGPLLLLIVWLASWIGRKGSRIGLMFISALLKGAASTLIGALIWIGALLLVDYLRLGRPF